MKCLLVILSTILSSLAFGNDCPNISGEFLSAEKQLLKIEQSTNCSSVKLRFGRISFTGNRLYKPGHLYYSINGDPSCQMPNGELCTKVSSHGEFITFETDYNGAVDGGIHGVCTYRIINRKLDSERNLVNIYDAYDCADGSSLKIEKVYYKATK